MIINIYTDGSCNNARNKSKLSRIGGYSCIIDSPDRSRQIIMGGEMNTSSARMELAAFQASLLYITKNYKHEPVDVNIFTDAEYVVNSINKGWIWRWIEEKWIFTKNSDIWRVIVSQLNLEAIASLDIKHVKGHSGIELNELADKKAEEARQMMFNLNKERHIKCYRKLDTGAAVIYKYNVL